MILEMLIQLREPYIALRNAILDNPLRFFSTTSRKDLSNINRKLDKIDLRIYDLQSRNIPKVQELESIIDNAQASIEKYFKSKNN